MALDELEAKGSSTLPAHLSNARVCVIKSMLPMSYPNSVYKSIQLYKLLGEKTVYINNDERLVP
jgi:hypothetical protein